MIYLFVTYSKKLIDKSLQRAISHVSTQATMQGELAYEEPRTFVADVCCGRLLRAIIFGKLLSRYI